jgi:hypothetical protein
MRQKKRYYSFFLQKRIPTAYVNCRDNLLRFETNSESEVIREQKQ